jgi:hypothetical protein
MEKMESGILPEKTFPVKSRVAKFGREPKPSGIGPVNRLLSRKL